MMTSARPAQGSQRRRLVSLDALRGFDMFWIIGARAIASGLAGLNLPGVSVITRQLNHSAWNGFTFYDLIFPLFIFMTGISLVLSLRRRLERGEDRLVILRHVVTRAVILFGLGIVYNGWDTHQPLWQSIRVMGVLQRSALCYLFGSLMVLYTKPRTQVITAAGILVSYWAVMRFVPVPGYGAGAWTESGNLARYIDGLLLPGRLYFGSWDPEGLLSTIPAFATCLLGVLTGSWLQAESSFRGRPLKPAQRAGYLFLAGVALAVLGLALSPVFPINKKLWTSTFVLLTGGLAAVATSAFHWIIDVRQKRRWAFPFVVVGMNSLLIYLAVRFIPFEQVAHWLSVNVLSQLGRSQSLFEALATLTLEALPLLWLYQRKIFVRI